ncbi:MAG TPA: hypothetical protein VGR16_06770 [Thermomicrobiales bacterium]|nr:hypothetical protein [Thermomicrobiales bacterium]
MEIDWLILADSAEVVNNKLYLLGGGWDSITVKRPFPVVHPCAVATAFSVPWNETNQPRNVEIEIMTEDGESRAKIAAKVEAGRPTGLSQGQAQRIQFAVRINLKLHGPGGHVIIARVEGEERRRVPFNIVAGSGSTANRPPR